MSPSKITSLDAFPPLSPRPQEIKEKRIQSRTTYALKSQFHRRYVNV